MPGPLVTKAHKNLGKQIKLSLSRDQEAALRSLSKASGYPIAVVVREVIERALPEILESADALRLLRR